MPELYKDVAGKSLRFLDKETFKDVLSGGKKLADLVVEFCSKEGKPIFLIHVEVQSQTKESNFLFGKRLFHYVARLYEKYNVPVVPVTIFALNTGTRKLASSFVVSRGKFEIITFRFESVVLRNLSWRQFKHRDSPISAAFMSKMKIAKDERVIVKLECLRMLSRLKLNSKQTHLIGGFIETYLPLSATDERQLIALTNKLRSKEREAVMEIATSWEKKGLKKGLQKGIQKGIQQGLKEGHRQKTIELTLRLLDRKIGNLPENLTERLDNLSDEQLTRFFDDVLLFNEIADVDKWLQEHGSPREQ